MFCCYRRSGLPMGEVPALRTVHQVMVDNRGFAIKVHTTFISREDP